MRITTTAICGSDLHLYEVLGAYLNPGDVLGHEAMGVVEEVGSEVTHIAPGDRVVVPFNISCGQCWMCSRGLYAQCETTQVRDQGKGAALFGYTSLYGSVPGGQAQFLRVPQAHFGPIKVPHEGPDTRFVYLSDILPTAWQAVAYADVPTGGTLAVIGLGPVGQFATRIALAQGVERVIGVDLVPERLDLAEKHGVEVLDVRDVDDVAATLLEMTSGRGPDATIDAVGMEAHGIPARTGGPDRSGSASRRAGQAPDRPVRGRPPRRAAYRDQVRTTRRDRLDQRGLRRRGRSHADDGDVRPGRAAANGPVPRQTVDRRDHAPRPGRDDPLGTSDLATHLLPLEQAPHGYEIFQAKQDACIKVLLNP